MKRRMMLPKSIVLSLLWAATGVSMHMSMIPLLSRLWVGVLALWGLHLAVGAALAIYLAVRFGASRSLAIAVALALVIAGFATFVFARGSLLDAGNVIAFRWLQPAYQRVIDKAGMERDAAAVLIASGPEDAVQFIYFSDDPDLIVFPWLNGIPDGGIVLVYDATADILDAGTLRSARLTEVIYSSSPRCTSFGAASFYLCEVG
jgi:hypothetical protein